MSISGHTCLIFRDVTTSGGDHLVERYEQTMTKLQRITSAGYTIEVVWECQFNKDILPRHREMKQDPIFQKILLIHMMSYMGGRTEVIVL